MPHLSRATIAFAMGSLLQYYWLSYQLSSKIIPHLNLTRTNESVWQWTRQTGGQLEDTNSRGPHEDHLQANYFHGS